MTTDLRVNHTTRPTPRLPVRENTKKPDAPRVQPGYDQKDSYTQPTQSRLFRAIVAGESGGRNVTNQDSGALGIGQVMPANVRAWSKEALGREISPDEFKRRPDLQTKIVQYKLNQYFNEGLKRTGNEREAVRYAAAKWYSGDGMLKDNTRPQFSNGRRYPSIADYSNGVLKRYSSLR
jgi:hypothetical protein